MVNEKYYIIAIVDSQIFFKSSEAVSQIRFMERREYKILLKYDTSGNIITEIFQFSDSSMTYNYFNKKLVWQKNLYHFPIFCHNRL